MSLCADSGGLPVLPPRLFFCVQKVVDFQWCPTVPWAIMSVSDDGADEESGGGSLQVGEPEPSGVSLGHFRKQCL